VTDAIVDDLFFFLGRRIGRSLHVHETTSKAHRRPRAQAGESRRGVWSDPTRSTTGMIQLAGGKRIRLVGYMAECWYIRPRWPSGVGMERDLATFSVTPNGPPKKHRIQRRDRDTPPRPGTHHPPTPSARKHDPSRTNPPEDAPDPNKRTHQPTHQNLRFTGAGSCALSTDLNNRYKVIIVIMILCNSIFVVLLN
jgi:hypothetical protein